MPTEPACAPSLPLMAMEVATQPSASPLPDLVSGAVGGIRYHRPLGAPRSFCMHLFCLQVSSGKERLQERLSPKLTEARICIGPHHSYAPIFLKCKSLCTSKAGVSYPFRGLHFSIGLITVIVGRPCSTRHFIH